MCSPLSWRVLCHPGELDGGDPVGFRPMPETILVERDAGVVTVTLNRPERKNAANGQMWLELRDLFYEVSHSSLDRVLVVTGAGGAFCSGADISDPKGVSGNPADPHLVRMQFLGEVMLALHEVPKPTIAKVRGIAAGAGLSLALGCDLVVAGIRCAVLGDLRKAWSVDGRWVLVVASAARRTSPGEGARILRRDTLG